MADSLVRLASIDHLRRVSVAWDDLWQRSEATLPVLRAELVAQCVEHLGPSEDFQALVVEQGGRWVAALPLVSIRRFEVLDAGAFPANRWGPAGRLLVDPAADVRAALDCLVFGIRHLPWPLLWLDHLRLDTAGYRALRAALTRAGLAHSSLERYRVAWNDIDHDWERFRQGWSRNFRRQLARRARRLAERGEVRFGLESEFELQTVESRLRRGFEVEDRNWKGREGGSVLRRGLLPFYLRQAQQLACWGHLRLAFLELDSRPIAFAYGIAAKGVFHLAKIGYDEQYAKYSPGNLLLERLYERLWSDHRLRAVDALGEITDDQWRWRPTCYPVGRLVVARQGVLARAAVFAHQHAWPHLRPWWQRVQGRTERQSTEARP
jgi:CelD/BcsL family acetyltransferase involved in cellulose biosynthesis